MKARYFLSRRCWLFSIVVCSILNLHSQENPITELFQIPIEGYHLTTDKIGQCYVVDNNNTLHKFDEKGKELFHYSNNTLGYVGLIDVTNPFHVLVFYPEFNRAVILNRTLNETKSIDLQQLDFLEVSGVGLSNDNNIWVYDLIGSKIAKVSHDGKILYESNDLSLLLNDRIEPTRLLERDTDVYLYDPKIGLLIFDLFANFEKNLPLKQVDQLQIFDNQVLYKVDETYSIYHLESLLEKSLQLPESMKPPLQLKLQKGKAYAMYPNYVSVFSIP